METEIERPLLAHAWHGPKDDAPIILYLHGLGIGGWCWEPVWAALPDYGALVPDLPGHGGSVGIPWQSLAESAERVTDLVDTLAPDLPVHVTGHSLGGYIGALLIAQRPDRFASALLSGFHIGSIRYPRFLKLAYTINGAIFRFPPLLRRVSKMFGGEETAQCFFDGARIMSPRTIRRAGTQVVDFQSPFEDHRPSIPMTIVAAEREPASIRETPARLAETLPNAKGIVLDGKDHLWPIKEPLRYADLLTSHLNGAD
ncbi:MAG: alpha/beta hydrolase [Pseudomonadota bacterium]